MEAMQVLAHQTAMGYRASLNEAFPDAPRLPHRPRARAGARVRVRLAHSLRRTADRLDPACRPA